MSRLALPCVVLVLFAAGCGGSAKQARTVPGGDAGHGEQLIVDYGCGSCHTIPGVDGADGLVGPSLQHLANRPYIGGVIENTPHNLTRWIQDPPAIDPQTAMPNVRVAESDARHIAAYLYTLR